MTVLESNNNRKVSDRTLNVVTASGEGRFFLKQTSAVSLKRAVLEPLASALGVAAVLHNDIIRL